MVVFLIVILIIWRSKKSFSSKSYPFSERCVVQAWCHPLIIVFDCENSFHPSRAIQESFQFDSPEPIISEDLFILSFQLSFLESYRCIAQVFPNQLVISSFTCIRSPQVSSFIFQVFPVNCAFATFFFNSMVLCSRFLFLCVHINLFVVSILPVVRWKPSHVCAISILTLSTRISSIPNPLLVINWNLWRIRIT